MKQRNVMLFRVYLLYFTRKIVLFPVTVSNLVQLPEMKIKVLMVLI